MSIRCYIPTTLSALGSGLGTVTAVTPDAQGRALSGDELESLEFDAMCIAAALAASMSFESGDADRADSDAEFSPRAVVAYDAPEAGAGRELSAGFELLTLSAVEMTRVASIHLDEAEVWNEAVRLARETGRAEAEDLLGESDLLWYDATELPELLRERG